MGDASQPLNPSKATLLTSAAVKAMGDAKGKAYTYGGKDTNGFDCSGFVYYVFHEVFGAEYVYLKAESIGASNLFEEVTDPQAGDVIYFPPGRNPYEVKKKNQRSYPAHVGVVLDDKWWIGSQSSTGVAKVPMDNDWWKSRDRKFYRYKGVKGVDHAYLQHRSRVRYA